MSFWSISHSAMAAVVRRQRRVAYPSIAQCFSTQSPTPTRRRRGGQQQQQQQHDRLLVVGSGVAGSAVALVAAQVYQIPVTMLFAGNTPHDCNSYWAQGGIIYRGHDGIDSAQLLAQDIHRAGAGLCQDDAVWKVSTEGPGRVRQLLLDDQHGVFAHVPFDKTNDGQLSLCLEASHSAPRILHHADHTGKLITQHINQAAMKHPLIQMQGNTIVTDLMVRDNQCVGVQTLNNQLWSTRGVVLCSGGLGGIYQHSTNPPGFNALGSSVALAKRATTAATATAAVVETRELEFVQFHPTSLNIPNEARFLLTEALRGEGAILRNADGRAFATDFHPDGELAPRDVVARGVFAESTKSPVFLDITHRPQQWLYERFPTIQAHLQERNLDISRDWLPVIPAAHYTCGGISTDLQGQTSLSGLYAAGEAARTGLHGGNRLASTSLLEGLVFGAAVAESVGSKLQDDSARQIIENILVSEETPLQQERVTPNKRNNTNDDDDDEEATELLRLVRKCMWDHVGVIRTVRGLQTALEELKGLQDEACALFDKFPSPQSAGVRDAATAGRAVAEAALQNRTSIGAHCIVQEDNPYQAESEDSDEEESVGSM